jgi:hypothetical protein
MTVSKNLILAFAPGSRGFLLSKWLYNNQLINVVFPPSDTSYVIDGNNHSLTPFYNDVLFSWDDTNSKKTYFNIEKEFQTTQCDHAVLAQLLSTSKFLPEKQNSRYNLILSHHGSNHGLSTLKTILNAQVIRITLTNSEIKDCYLRKFVNHKGNSRPSKSAVLDILSTTYYPFLENFDFAINIKLSQVENLKLDFLIKELI